MILYIYLFYTVLMGICMVEGIPVIDIFSTSWHGVAKFILGFSAFLGVFVTVFNILGYFEEREDTTGTFAQIYLRTLVGQKFLSKWPVYLWFGYTIALIQFNHLLLAVLTFALAVLASSVVLVQNSLYNNFLVESAKGE